MKLPKILLFILGLIIVINLAVLDYFLITKTKTNPTNLTNETNEDLSNKVIPAGCDQSCKDEINKQVKDEVSKIALPTSTVVYSNTPAASTVANQSKVVYVPISADGAIASNDWQEIVPSEFYFDLSDYPGAKEVRFLAYVLSINNDSVSARLYDKSNNRGVDLSDLQTQSSTFVRLESGPIVIWRGNNKYSIQLRSVNGTQAQLKDAKLKIVY